MPDVLDTLQKLPPRCFAMIYPGEVFVIQRGVQGKYPVVGGGKDFWTQETVDHMNADMGVTPAQREAMIAGSMFGWDVPGADPDMYDANGGIITEKVAELIRRSA